MIRQINLINGFFDQNTKNFSYFYSDTYPIQKENTIGKWTAVRFLNESNSRMSYYKYTANGIDCIDRNGIYYYKDSDLKVPEFDKDGNKIKIEKFLQNPNINNRFKLFQREYKNLKVENSGEQYLFQILRYDDKDKNNYKFNHKVILRDIRNEIIVMTTELFESIFDLENSDCLRRAKLRAKKLGGEYLSPNITNDKEEFINYYNSEYIHLYPIQDQDLLGLNVYSEFQGDISYIDSFDRDIYMKKHGKYYYKEDNSLVSTLGPRKKRANRIKEIPEGDLFTKNKSYNTMSKKEYSTKDDDPLIKRGDKYFYYDSFFGDNDPRNEEYTGEVKIVNANRFKITDRIRRKIKTEDPNSKGLKKEQLNSYPYYHNIYANSYNNLPRRAHNKGIILRADLNSANPQVVVMEKDDNNNIRFICQDEARFFFNTLNKEYSLSYLTDKKLL